MFISTKGRYAIRVLVSLAKKNEEGFVPLKLLAEEQVIPQKYLEGIMNMLSKADVVQGLHGKGGGYRLSRDAEEISILEVLKATEKSLAPVTCMEDCAEKCHLAEGCNTLPMWQEFDRIVNGYFTSVSVADLITGDVKRTI